MKKPPPEGVALTARSVWADFITGVRNALFSGSFPGAIAVQPLEINPGVLQSDSREHLHLRGTPPLHLGFSWTILPAWLLLGLALPGFSLYCGQVRPFALALPVKGNTI